MTDDPTIRGPEDPTKINLNQPHEVRYWCKKWSITRDQLKEAVKAAGVLVSDVEAYLRDKELIDEAVEE